MPNRSPTAGLAVASAALGFLLSRPATAQSVIKSPGEHPHYVFEAEPHLALSYKAGYGPGFRATIALLDKAFIPSLNNSIGIGVGADWLFYGKHCEGPLTARVCGESEGDVMIPIVLQWNFWIIQWFSVFGEPGFALHVLRGRGDDFAVDPFTIFAGMRIHFTDSVALTVRVGAPELFHHDSTITIGVSFLL